MKESGASGGRGWWPGEKKAVPLRTRRPVHPTAGFHLDPRPLPPISSRLSLRWIDYVKAEKLAPSCQAGLQGLVPDIQRAVAIYEQAEADLSLMNRRR